MLTGLAALLEQSGYDPKFDQCGVMLQGKGKGAVVDNGKGKGAVPDKGKAAAANKGQETAQAGQPAASTSGRQAI